jgi:ABC-2 type transport system ATP-binding protein
MDAAIRIEGLVKSYGDVVAVGGLDLEVARGECFGLLGPNGAGKTTTIEILEGLLPPTAGTVEVLGRRWNRQPAELRARIGVALQETKLFDRLTVEETLRLFRTFYVGRATLSVDALLDEMQLGEKRATWVMKLSGGQRQRLAVALGLIGDPEILFLDEPTTGLDPQSRRALWDTIAALRTRGKTIVLTTHYMDEAERLCDRVAIMDHGRIIALDSPERLIASTGGEHIVEFAITGNNGDHGVLDAKQLTGIAGVQSHRVDAGVHQLSVRELHTAVPRIFDALTAQGLHLSEFRTHSATLEDVFVGLTGRNLRDE